MRTLRLLTLCLVIIMALAACQPESHSGSDPLGTPSILPASSPESAPRETDSVFDDPAGEKMVRLVKERLAKKLGIPLDQIVLMGAEPVTWPDAGLGCPEPGVVYVPRETPGYSVILKAVGMTYIYHTDAVYALVLCDTR